MKAAPVAVKKPQKRKVKDNDVVDAYFDDDDYYFDEDNEYKEICAVRFPQNGGWSRKRYCYYSDSILDPGDWVIVNVGNEESKKATKSIKRLANGTKIFRTKRKYPNASIGKLSN